MHINTVTSDNVDLKSDWIGLPKNKIGEFSTTREMLNSHWTVFSCGVKLTNEYGTTLCSSYMYWGGVVVACDLITLTCSTI